jgi:large repetitive protein
VTQTFLGSVTVQDAAGASVTKIFSITINPALKITTTSLPSPKTGVNYTASLQATGGTGGETFSVTGGTLPTGLKLASAGVLSGDPQKAGTFTFTITATDVLGDKFKEEYSLLVS